MWDKTIENHMVMPVQTIKCNCYECGGRGEVLEQDGDGFESWVTCYTCLGKGYIKIER